MNKPYFCRKFLSHKLTSQKTQIQKIYCYFKADFHHAKWQLISSRNRDKIIRQKTIFNFHLNNIAMFIIKNKQNFYSHIPVILQIRLFITFENVISNWDERIIIYLL